MRVAHCICCFGKLTYVTGIGFALGFAFFVTVEFGVRHAHIEVIINEL